MSKLFNTFICIIHSKTNTTSSFKFVHLHFLLSSIISSKNDFKCSRLINSKVCCFILISKCMSTNDDWFCPSRNQSGNIFNNNRLSEYCSIKNVSNGSIWTFPHFFQVKLFNSSLIRSDSGTFDSDFAFFNGFSCLYSNFIICSISMLNA